MWQILEYSLADSLDTASSVNAVQESTLSDRTNCRMLNERQSQASKRVRGRNRKRRHSESSRGTGLNEMLL